MRSEIRTHTQNDDPIAGLPGFAEWIGNLESIMREWDAKHGNLPYTLPLSESTGLDCWHDAFADEMTPQETFDSDQSYWEQ